MVRDRDRKRGDAVSRFTVQRYCAKNDTNGNPRRVYVIRNGEGDIVATVDEGHRGRTVVGPVLWSLTGRTGTGPGSPWSLWFGVTDLGDVDVSPGVYRRMVKYVPEVKR